MKAIPKRRFSLPFAQTAMAHQKNFFSFTFLKFCPSFRDIAQKGRYSKFTVKYIQPQPALFAILVCHSGILPWEEDTQPLSFLPRTFTLSRYWSLVHDLIAHGSTSVRTWPIDLVVLTETWMERNTFTSTVEFCRHVNTASFLFNSYQVYREWKHEHENDFSTRLQKIHSGRQSFLHILTDGGLRVR